MQYPDELYQRGRKKLDKSAILSSDYLYARHKPGYDWNEKEGLPDYTKIKIDPENKEKNQSLNWDRFSKPHWVRFNPNRVYQKEYAVVGFLTETIRHIEKYENNSELDLSDMIDVEHDPVEINYSHCQISCSDKFRITPTKKEKKSIKRALRMAMRHRSKVFLKPYEE
jgi:hypothetical protein